jgi:hypothetical protein
MGDHGHLQVDGSASGPVQSFLRFVATSPVKEWTANVTETRTRRAMASSSSSWTCRLITRQVLRSTASSASPATT